MSNKTHKVDSYSECMRGIRDDKISVGDTVEIKQMQTTFLVKAKDDIVAVQTTQQGYEYLYNEGEQVQ